MNSNTEYLEIDMIRLVKALLHRLWLILLSAVLCAGLAFGGVRYFVTPKYESSVLLYVNNSSFSLGNTNFKFSPSDLNAAKTLVDTYVVILETRSTLETVISKAELDYTYSELKNMIHADAVNGTEVFEVVVTSTSPEEAEKIANTIAQVLPDKVAAIVDGSSVRVVDYAVVPKGKASPNVSLYTMLGLLTGIALACGVIILLEMMDDQIHDEDFLNQSYDIPVLASIPNLKSNHGGSYGKYGGYYGNNK